MILTTMRLLFSGWREQQRISAVSCITRRHVPVLMSQSLAVQSSEVEIIVSFKSDHSKSVTPFVWPLRMCKTLQSGRTWQIESVPSRDPQQNIDLSLLENFIQVTFVFVMFLFLFFPLFWSFVF